MYNQSSRGSSPASDANSRTARRQIASDQSNLDPPAPSNPNVNIVNTQSPQRQGILRGAVDLEQEAIREEEKRARIEKFEGILNEFKDRVSRRIVRLNQDIQNQKNSLQ